jgi:hypothetical protein
MDVRVVEPREDAPAAEVDDLRRGERGLVDTYAACAIASARAVGRAASIVRMTPFSRITAGT